MRHKKGLWSTTLFLCLAIAGLQAQKTLFVEEKSGTQTPFAIASINKLTFATGNMLVNKKDGSSSTYELTKIRFLNFGNTSNIENVNLYDFGNLFFYPNPAIDELNIRFESLSFHNMQLVIMDVQGRIIHQQTINFQNGTNFITIPVTKLQSGFYLCRLQNDKNFEFFKFMKH